MMKTIFLQNTILYQRLIAAPIKEAINGGVYKLVRPNKSANEDVVINSIDLTGETVLRGASNVNIHVPTIQAGKNRLPDTERMEQLTELALQTLHEGYGPDYNFWCDSHRVIEETDASGQTGYYVNLRVEFKFHNSLPAQAEPAPPVVLFPQD